ncbi:Toll/interleukin-1 receptor domain-containing protein, partial [Tanacetum coccineum]
MASSSSSSASSFWSRKYNVFLSFHGEDTRKTFIDHLYKAFEDRLVRTYKDDITLPKGESVGPALLEAIEESEDMGIIVISIFYDVDPSKVRNHKRKFGKVFSRQKMKNVTKAESWRKSLVGASDISGWEPKNIASGHEAGVIQKILDAILEKLLSSNSDIDEEFVRMMICVNDLISSLQVGTGGVRMVGIWGLEAV